MGLNNKQKRFSQLIVFCSAIVIISCSNTHKKDLDLLAQNIYSERTTLIKEFNHVGVFVRDGKKILTIYDKNEYRFKFSGYKRSNKKPLVLSDSLNNEEIVFLTKYLNLENKINVEEQFLIYAHNLFSRMYDLSIEQVGLFNKKLGIDIEFFLKEGCVLCINNLESISNGQWKKTISESEKIDENWYWFRYNQTNN